MDGKTELDKFLEERSRVPIPSGDVARVKLLAKELALGVHKDLWDRATRIIYEYDHPIDSNQSKYLEVRWGDSLPTMWMAQLQGHGYMEDAYNSKGNRHDRLASAAFALLTEAPPYRVFISYTHKESSAFALLLVTKLKHYGIQPFCDMSLVPGEEWHPELEKQIKECEHFIVLISKETRNSDATLKEVTWALKENKIVIPIWHNGFEFKSDDWEGIDCAVVSAIQRKHAVIVQKESAAGYNTAIVELLTNRFGVTP